MYLMNLVQGEPLGLDRMYGTSVSLKLRGLNLQLELRESGVVVHLVKKISTDYLGK